MLGYLFHLQPIVCCWKPQSVLARFVRDRLLDNPWSAIGDLMGRSQHPAWEVLYLYGASWFRYWAVGTTLAHHCQAQRSDRLPAVVGGIAFFYAATTFAQHYQTLVDEETHRRHKEHMQRAREADELSVSAEEREEELSQVWRRAYPPSSGRADR